MKKISIGLATIIILLAATAATATQIGGDIRETINIKNEVEMSKVIITFIDRNAFDNRERIIAPIYILKCETTLLRMPNTISAKIPTSLLKSGLLNSPKVKIWVRHNYSNPRPVYPL